MTRPVVIGAATERFAAVPAAAVRHRAALEPALPTDGLVLLGTRRALESGAPVFRGVPDGNRGVVFPDVVTEIGGRGYALSVKGAGALAPLYGELPVDYAFGSDFGGAPDAHAGARVITAETWFGEAPYGGQGEAGAGRGLGVTELARGTSIRGFHVCPIVALLEVPEEHVSRDRFWYRRHRGPVLQEHRLVPSNIRLYHESPRALGREPDVVLEALGVSSREALDAFIERYIASGVAALTLWARTVREGPHAPAGLDYEDVWLDKDSLIAPDGTLHFADLEGLDWWEAWPADPAEARIRRQLDRNCYELMYGLDMLSRVSERRSGRPLGTAERRAMMAARVELALAGDPFARAERRSGGLDLVVTPALPVCDPVVVRWIDLE